MGAPAQSNLRTTTQTYNQQSTMAPVSSTNNQYSSYSKVSTYGTGGERLVGNNVTENLESRSIYNGSKMDRLVEKNKALQKELHELRKLEVGWSVGKRDKQLLEKIRFLEEENSRLV